MARVAICALVGAYVLTTSALAHPGLHHDIERVSRELVAEPDRVDLLLRRAILFRLNDEPAKSLVDLDRARVLEPENITVVLQRGLALSALKRDGEAEVELGRYICVGGGRPEALAERARIRERTNRPALAIEDYGAALALRSDVAWYLARGRLQELLGQLDEAATGYREALAQVGGAVVVRDALIRVEIARGRYADALAELDTLLAQAPNKTKWLLRRAKVRQASGAAAGVAQDFAEALREADHAVTRRKTALSLCSRAEVLIALGRLAEARRDLLEANRLVPAFADARTLLAELDLPEQDSGNGAP